jgi:hypothetical protein
MVRINLTNNLPFLSKSATFSNRVSIFENSLSESLPKTDKALTIPDFDDNAATSETNDGLEAKKYQHDMT